MNKKMVEQLKQLVIDLVDANYDQIVLCGKNGRLTREEIENEITMYPGQITAPHENAYHDLDLYEIKNSDGSIREWSVDFDLWFDGERSDLTLQASLVKTNEGEYIIGIDDIHVM